MPLDEDLVGDDETGWSLAWHAEKCVVVSHITPPPAADKRDKSLLALAPKFFG